MAKQDRRIEPRTYYLNERQQLREVEKKGGGGLPKLGSIDWTRRGRQIKASLDQVRAAVADSKDPLRDKRYFLVLRHILILG